MNLEKLKAQLTIDENRVHEAYPDPRTKSDPWTIGIGHTGPEVHKGLVWSDAQIDAAYDEDVQGAIQGLDNVTPWWRGLDTVRQNVLLNMCFNMGEHRLAGFKKMLNFCALDNYSSAADEMLDSAWSKQVGARAQRLTAQMRTGEF